MLEARLLGQFDVRLDGKPVVISSRAAQSLLAYLLLNPGTAHRREKLAGLLWPDASEDNARRNLRQELWRLRKSIGPDYFRADDIAVSLIASDDLWLDVSVLQQGTANAASPNGVAVALSNYRGELLPGFYDEWLTPERERLRAVFEQATARLLEQLTTERRWAEVREWAERWIALGHSPEPAFRALMLAHAEQGDRAQVAAVYRRCVDALRSDLGVEPSEQTRSLYEQLVSGKPSAAPLISAATPAGPADATVLPAPGEPPFKGLLYFDEADAANFFGREQLTARLVAQLRGHSLLVVVGASGSGKSSLVRAGLVPALRQREFSAGGRPAAINSAQSLIYLVTPTAHPLEALAVCLTRDSESVSALATLIDDMARDPRSLRFALRRALPSGPASRVVLVVDQFEELFTLCHAEPERQAFVGNLLGAVEPDGEGVAKVVLALRADFYEHCAESEGLREAVAKHQEYIGPLSSAELRRSIEGPAQQGGWEFEAGLVDLILRDVGAEPGALPLLSHALLETWRRRKGRVLTLQGYAECGGVRGAVAQTAETVYREFNPDQQAIARYIFLRLTELGEGTQDTRRHVTIGELSSRTTDAPAITNVLQTLADARLITLGADSAEVAHEALIREWPRLREWLAQDREGLRLHRHLSEAAQAWSKLERDLGELYRGARLAQALEWARDHGADLNLLESEFLDASQAALVREEEEREAQRRRELEAAQRLAEAERRRAEEHIKSEHTLRRRALFLASALLLAALLAASSALLAQQSNASAERAEDERRIAFVRELSVNAVSNLDVDPERSILLALQAVSVSSANGKPVLREAEEALHRAVGASRVELTLRGHTNRVNGVVFSPDGKRLATASHDQTAKVWDAATGKELLTLAGHTNQIQDVTFSPDGTRIATASSDETAKVWDVATGKELLTLRGHTDEIQRIAYSPDGRLLVTAAGRLGSAPSDDHTAKVWDATTGQLLLTFTGHNGSTRGIAFSPDGTRVASAIDDGTVKVWDVTTAAVLLTLTGHIGVVYDVVFSPDGKRLVTGGADSTLRVWDAVSGKVLLTLFDFGTVWAVAINQAGTRLYSASLNGMAKVWDAATGQLLFTLAGHTGGLRGLALSPDGTRLATAGDDGTAKVWNVTPAGGKEWLNLSGHTAALRDGAFSPDGMRIATGSTDKTVKVWNATTGQLLLTLAGHSDRIQTIAYSPDGRRLASTGFDSTVIIWDAVSGEELLSFPTQAPPYIQGNGVAFSPDGQRIAASSAGNTAKIWDANTGKELLTLSGHSGVVNRLAFSPDGKRIATAGEDPDQTAKVWDVATGKELLTLKGHTAGVYNVVFSPDGARIATVGRDATARVWVWEASTGKELLTLIGHTAQVGGVAFSPDGTRLATNSADGTTKVWDITSGPGRSEQPLTLYRGGDPSFSPDGKRLLTAGSDGIARVWALALEDLVAIAKTRVTRGLTNDECQKYLHVETCPESK